MTEPPYILDNREPETLHAAGLAALFEQFRGAPLAIATGYVNLGGLHALAELDDGRPMRLLIGAVPDPGLGAQLPAIERFRLTLEALRTERDFSRFPPSRAAERLAAVDAWLADGSVEVRRYTRQFLHGKAYLFGDESLAGAALVTSANLTASGLEHNLELGLTSYGPPAKPRALAWFEALWQEAEPFDDDLRALLFPDPGVIDPGDVYLRALLELHTPATDDPDRASRPTGLELARFQRDGYERARAIAKRHGGVVYADGVGTGKTEIGLAFIEERIKEDGVYALVITPAQLKRRWQERIDATKLSAQVVSFNELASDEQLVPAHPQARRHLNVGKDYYRLVVVDEAHALRNEDTTWYAAMERLLGGTEKQVVLLTATPINNGLWDLHNLVLLFARHDRGLATAGIDSIRDLFLAAGANERDPESLNPEVLYPLADAVSVRRDRAFIERSYPGATFPDGTAVRFPRPRLRTVRYDLDDVHPGLFQRIAERIGALSMARYRPSAYELGGEESSIEAQLGGLLQSGLLKRFESCWQACLETVRRMIAAHDAFLAAWERGEVLSGEDLLAAADEERDESGLASWIEEQLASGMATRSTGQFREEFGHDVAADREHLAAIRDELAGLDPESDPKLRKLAELLEASPARKIAVFATYGATIRYLHRHLPEQLGGRERIAVIGTESTPDERLAALGRFAPRTVVRPDYEPPEGEVDLLLSTDVLSEGQNLQQAQAVVSYDMPWNPQRVVQRNGRVIRLLSEHEEVQLTTMLPEPGELEDLLRLEARVQGKIKAASGVYGMESEVIEGLEAELHAYAERVAEGDETLLDEAEKESGAFVGEELRRLIDRALEEGEVRRVQALPWGIGACFRQRPGSRSVGAPGIFFAVRTPPDADVPQGYRYWRFVEMGADGPTESELVVNDLEILRRIDPQGGEPIGDPTDLNLEAAWEVAAASIIAEHAKRTDLRREQERVGPRQLWALELLRDPSVAPTSLERAQRAAEALAVGRSSAVRRRLGEIQEQVAAGAINRDRAADLIVELVEDFGLRKVEPLPVPAEISADELGVVCWMVVLGGSDRSPARRIE